MRQVMHSIKLIIVDEVSMLSNLNFQYMQKRLDALFDGDEWFGGINMLFVGDLLQLPPVNANPVFVALDNRTRASKLGVIGSVNVWNDNVVYDELTINERQKIRQHFYYSTFAVSWPLIRNSGNQFAECKARNFALTCC